MKVTIEEVNNTRKKLHVSLTAAEIAQEEAALIQEFAKSVRMPGFRSGKAPVQMVKAKYKKEIAAELSRKLVSKAYEDARKDSKLDIFSVVEVDGGEFEAGKDGEVTLTVDLQPKIELPEYKGLEVKVASVEVTESEFDQTKNYILNQRAQYDVVEKGAEKGDYVKLSYTGKIGDQLIDEIAPERKVYGTQTNTWEEAGVEEGIGVPAIVNGILGLKAGDRKTVTEKFAADHEVEALRGKEGTYEIEVHEVREKKLPALDEEFLKGFGVDSAEKWEERIREDIKRQKEQHSDGHKRQQIIDQLIAAVEIELPQSAIDQERDIILRDVVARNQQRGVTEDQLEAEKDKLVEQATTDALSRVKAQFLLGEIAKKENVKVENEDMQRAILSQAMQLRVAPDQLVKELQKNRELLVNLQRNVLLQKTLDLVASQAKVIAVDEPAAVSA